MCRCVLHCSSSLSSPFDIVIMGSPLLPIYLLGTSSLADVPCVATVFLQIHKQESSDIQGGDELRKVH